MNIVIVGCGNVGFETAKLLAENNSILLISRHRPRYLTEFLERQENVSFALGDATDLSVIDNILDQSGGRFAKIDALVSTVGAFCPASPKDNFDKFRSSFELNFFGNLVPIQAVLKRMIPVRAGRIIVLSSTSGVFTYEGLSAYPPAKWALTSLCRSLRSELRPYGISVDVLFPRTIKNKYSRSFVHKHGIDPEQVAAKIAKILKGKGNLNHFVPRRYALLQLIERVFPAALDRRAGLRGRRKRRKNFQSRQIKNVLITGASSGLVKELAKLYSKTAERIYLVARNHQLLSQIKSEITQSCECVVNTADIDMADSRAIANLANTIDHTDLLINHAGTLMVGQAKDIPIDVYKQNLATDFFGPVQLTAEFLKKERKPIKIVNILPVSAIGTRKEFSSCSAAKAALWAFTRSLRRTAGNELQVIEVLPPIEAEVRWTGDESRYETRGTENETRLPRKALNVKGLTIQDIAEEIYEAERKAREIVLIPFRSKLFLYLDAIFPWVFQRLFG